MTSRPLNVGGVLSSTIKEERSDLGAKRAPCEADPLIRTSVTNLGGEREPYGGMHGFSRSRNETRRVRYTSC